MGEYDEQSKMGIGPCQHSHVHMEQGVARFQAASITAAPSTGT